MASGYSIAGPVEYWQESSIYKKQPSAKDLPFTPGVPDHRAFPEKIWPRLHRRHANRKSLKRYDGIQGYPPLQDALANYLKISRGVLCDADQIIITQGAQQEITLCSGLLLNEGDEVLMENPGYSHARRAFQIRQAKLNPIPVGCNGIDINALPKQTQTKLMYITPTHQYASRRHITCCRAFSLARLGGIYGNLLTPLQRRKVISLASPFYHKQLFQTSLLRVISFAT